MNITRPEHRVSVAASLEIHLVLNSFFRNKAVSDGALSFYHDHFVRIRVSKLTYGSCCHTQFNPTAPGHQQRAHKAFAAASGLLVIPDVFDVIVSKVGSFFSVIARRSSLFSIQNTQVSESKEFRRSHFCDVSSTDELKQLTTSVSCYRGDLITPEWKDIDPRKACFCTI